MKSAPRMRFARCATSWLPRAEWLDGVGSAGLVYVYWLNAVGGENSRSKATAGLYGRSPPQTCLSSIIFTALPCSLFKFCTLLTLNSLSFSVPASLERYLILRNLLVALSMPFQLLPLVVAGSRLIRGWDGRRKMRAGPAAGVCILPLSIMVCVLQYMLPRLS